MTLPIFFANTTDLTLVRQKLILEIAHSTFETCALVLPIQRTDVIIHVKPDWAIPETGVGGFSPTATHCLVHLNPRHADFDTNLETELAPTIAHELHHCARHGGVGYGHTLLEALVTEGLACVFEREFRGGKKPIYAQALNQDQIDEFLEKAQYHFSQFYNHNNWFFGNSTLGFPKWTGYTMGDYIVQHYLEQTGLSAGAEWNTPALRFIER
jgi:uncharacterized protein YjaZ